MRVFVLGDSVAFNLHTQFRGELAPGIDVRGSTKLGCGLVAGRLVIGGRAEPEPEPCQTWPDEWRLQAGEWDPEVSVVLPGIGELFDHQVGRSRLRFGSQDYADYLLAELDAAVRSLAPHPDDRVALLTLPCHRKPDSGLDHTVGIVNDQQRHDWVNDVLRSYAARRPAQVVVVDWAEFLCPGGAFVERRDGVTLRPDGVHLSDAATELAWRWLGPQLREIADR